MSRFRVDDGRPRRAPRPWSRKGARAAAAAILSTPESIRAQQERVCAAQTVEGFTVLERDTFRSPDGRYDVAPVPSGGWFVFRVGTNEIVAEFATQRQAFAFARGA